ncbi:Alkylation repair enzyme superfamily protein [Candidatus Roizmanbacteria bacterium]|nr:Alkylation repair enzyme superfamily protein [Candidatus Roizmanbacteria bacterium]
MFNKIIKDLQESSDPERAKNLQWFFKTGKGEYGKGDIFLGITVPMLRSISKKYQNLDLAEIQKLIENKIHEYRLSALMILRFKYEKTLRLPIEKRVAQGKEIVVFYLKNTKKINNWDLVDLSCHYILGNYLLDKDRAILYQLAKSKNLWKRRIAIISTFEFIRNHQYIDTLEISKILLKDKHDLIHKAGGWMLRELGKRDKKTEIDFLNKHYKSMPRTMLRYAIEKFSDRERKIYLAK